MGWEILAVVFGVFLLPLITLGFVLFWWATSRERDELSRVWSAYARKRRFELAAPEGEWPNRTAPIVFWAEPGARYRFEVRGREARVRTRLVARPEVGVFGELAVTAAPRAIRSSGTFDVAALGRFTVRARPAGFAERILTPDVTRALLGFDLGDDVVLAYARGDVWLEWAGGETNAARLDEARGVVGRVVRALRAAYGAAA